ncbi:hypothetical protein D3C85_943760 [compost metagenome]
MALVGNDQVEEAHIELSEAVHHARVGCNVDACGLIHLVCFTNHTARLARQILLEGLISLHTQLLAVTEKKHAFGPTSAQKQLGQGNGHTGFSGPGSLDDQRLAALLLEVRSNSLDCFNLVGPVGNTQLRVVLFQLRDAVLTLIVQVFKAVLAVEAVHRTIGVVLLVVPDEGFVTVAVENHRALHAHALEAVGVHTGLFAPCLQTDIAGLLGFDHGQGLAVVTP